MMRRAVTINAEGINFFIAHPKWLKYTGLNGDHFWFYLQPLKLITSQGFSPGRRRSQSDGQDHDNEHSIIRL